MVTMYDSVTPSAIPADAPIVAGYQDGIYRWPTNAWLMFPKALHVGIVVKASSNAGQVLDVETGDALPSEAPGWVTMRRAAGQIRPTVYMNASTWPAVRAAFVAAKVPEPDYWVAKYDGNPALPPGAVAKQYLGYPGGGSPGAYDVSSTDGVWPNPVPPPVLPEVLEDMGYACVIAGGVLHVFGEVNGVAYHWFQPNPFPQGHTPTWEVERLPTP